MIAVQGQGCVCHFGSVLHRARLEKGMSQRRLARQLGVVQQTVSAVERGHRRCPPDVVTKAANVLGLNVPETVNKYCAECPVRYSSLGAVV